MRTPAARSLALAALGFVLLPAVADLSGNLE
jgi:hypothetical protein